MRLVNLLALSAAIAFAQQQIGSIQQKSSGPCTVNNSGIQGNVEVTINCPGVDPRAMRVFNEQIRKLGDQINSLKENLSAAEDWRSKYQALTERLATLGIENLSSKKAEELIRQGRLDEAEKLLDEILRDEEQEVDRVAKDYFNRAQLYELKFQPLKALSDYERAYQYRADNLDYAEGYATLLVDQKQYSKAEEIFTRLLLAVRDLRKANTGPYDFSLARTLNKMGSLYQSIQKSTKAKAAFQEALDIYRQLARTDPAAYQPWVATTLLHLGELDLYYDETQRLNEAEEAFREAQDIYRRLARANPAAYEPFVLMTLNNLGTLYQITQKLTQAEVAFQETLNISRQLERTNPAYQTMVWATLVDLGILYRDTQKLTEAGAAFREALSISRQAARVNPAAQSVVAMTLNDLGSLGVFYRDSWKLDEAEVALREALEINRELANLNPAAYQRHVASTLNALAELHAAMKRVKDAETEVAEALGINQQLWKQNPAAHGDDLAKSLLVETILLRQTGRNDKALCSIAKEAATVAYDPRLKERARSVAAECKQQ